MLFFVFFKKKVVYLLNPTSNHNMRRVISDEQMVVYLLNPTSNHNNVLPSADTEHVVYLLNPTSNHNNRPCGKTESVLYIF